MEPTCTTPSDSSSTLTFTSPARTLVTLLAIAAQAACGPAATTPGATPGPEAVAERIAEGPAAPADAAVRVPVEVLERYVGEYELPPGAIVTVRRDGDRLAAQPTGHPEATVLEPRLQTRFEVRGVPVAVEFVTDEAGVVNLVLYQNDQEMRGRRRSP